ncbi:MAG: hypothetical protein JSS00_04810 [Proteobacteria bacterium]|nr:hypothetical protein [Pseudomonadota bacterium]
MDLPVTLKGFDAPDEAPEPHDSWVVGDAPPVSLHFLGADHYAAAEHS